MRAICTTIDNGKAIRYGVTVGEEALVFSGVAKVGRREEWPSWTPTADIKKRLTGIPDFVGPGPHNPLGARGLYLYSGNKDTLYRIHGTNQPEYIGSAISSGCIRMTNEDVIDLYNRVKLGTPVVVLALTQGDSPFNPRMALGGTPGGEQLCLITIYAVPAPDFGAAFVFAGRPFRPIRIVRRGRSGLPGRGSGMSLAIAAGSSTFHWQIR